MTTLPILSILTFLPLIGAIFIALFVPSNNETDSTNTKYAALFTTLFTLGISLFLLKDFDKAIIEYQFVEQYEWITGYNISYHLGVDSISLSLILLTTILLPICVLASWKSINKRVKEYMICFLAMESFIIGVFCSLDFVMFYIFFEVMLIPMYLLIGIWGGENRVYSAFKFFLYTLAGSLLLLLALVFVYGKFNTTDIVALTKLVPTLPLNVQKWLWLGLFASFAVKVPMWPFHTWLPDAHVQAPTAGSVILAGVLLKMGAYGFIRFSLPMLPAASLYFSDFVFYLSVIAIIYTSLVALVQTDMKKLIAYSSVAHMGFVTIGIFSFNEQGMQGAMVQVLSHGFVSAALFLVVGVLYDRMHSREISVYGGVTEKMPSFALIFMFFTLASVGLPGTSGFIGEFLSLVGVYQVHKLFGVLATTGIVLGAAYMLLLYKRVMFGEITNSEVAGLTDLGARERLIFAPLWILVLLVGIYPSILTSYFTAPINNIIDMGKFRNHPISQNEHTMPTTQNIQLEE